MELIQGIHIDVPGSEMKSLFESRLKYHQDKVAKLEGQLGVFKQLDKELAEEANEINRGSNSFPASNLEDTLRKHKNYIVYFKFMVEHVVVDATYRLGKDELLELGIRQDNYRW